MLLKLAAGVFLIYLISLIASGPSSWILLAALILAAYGAYELKKANAFMPADHDHAGHDHAGHDHAEAVVVEPIAPMTPPPAAETPVEPPVDQQPPQV